MHDNDNHEDFDAPLFVVELVTGAVFAVLITLFLTAAVLVANTN